MAVSRRTVLSGLVTLATGVALPETATARPGRRVLPLVPALPPVDADVVERLRRGLARWGRMTDMPALAIENRILYQHMVGWRLAALAWPGADALRAIQAIGDRWPHLQPNIDRLLAARAAGLADFDTRTDWDYSNVRIDGGPPPRPEVPWTDDQPRGVTPPEEPSASAVGPRQGLVEVGEQILDVLDAGREAQQVDRARGSGPLDGGPMLDQALDAAE